MDWRGLVWKIGLAGCVTALLCGCTAAPPDGADSVAAEVDAAPHKVTVADIISTEPPQFAGMEVVEGDGLVDWAVWPFPERIMPLADAVVYGEVTDKEYVNVGANSWTKFDVAVEQTLRGDVPAGTAVTVYSVGGYITQYDFFTASGDRARMTGRTDAQRKQTVMHQDAVLHFDPLVGKRYILLLGKSDAGSNVPQQGYETIGAKYCQLCETAPDVFSYIAYGPDPDDPDAAFSPDDPVVQLTRAEVENMLAEEGEAAASGA